MRLDLRMIHNLPHSFCLSNLDHLTIIIIVLDRKLLQKQPWQLLPIQWQTTSKLKTRQKKGSHRFVMQKLFFPNCSWGKNNFMITKPKLFSVLFAVCWLSKHQQWKCTLSKPLGQTGTSKLPLKIIWSLITMTKQVRLSHYSPHNLRNCIAFFPWPNENPRVWLLQQLNKTTSHDKNHKSIFKHVLLNSRT